MTRIIPIMCTCLLLTAYTITCAQTNDTAHKNSIVPARIALTPGISSLGKKDPYTTTTLSINILGGSTGSINGVELGSLFNIDKGNVLGVQAGGLWNTVGGLVNGVQMGGLFNATSGSVKGIQMGGLFNTSSQSVTGIQMGGVANYAGDFVYGIQMGGLYNQVAAGFTGTQMAGVANYTLGAFKGIQMAGIANINNSTFTGIQMAGIFNYTKHLKGLQLGLINIADTSDGYSIGLITIVKNGYHKVTVSSNEVLNTNIALKSGNAKLYNILMVGVNAGNDNKLFSYGYGVGHEIKLGNRFTVNPELTSQYLYLGSWHYTNILNKVQVLATIKLMPKVSLFAGPSFSVYYSDQTTQVKGYKLNIPSSGYHAFDMGSDKVTGWFGWSVGVSFL